MPYCNDIFYRIYDDNPGKFTYPVILLHGSGGSHMAWPSEMRRLAGNRVIALDLPGHGKTTMPACQSINALVICLRRFLQEMEIYQVVLIGHSLGAVLALQYASLYPEYVRGMFLLACGNHFSLPTSIFSQLRNPGQKDKVIEKYNQIVFDTHFPQEARRKILAPLRMARNSTLLADLTICTAFNGYANFARINCPVHLISGENDQITQPSAARQLTHTFSKAAYTNVPQCGHLLIYEKTDFIVQKIRGLLGDMTAMDGLSF